MEKREIVLKNGEVIKYLEQGIGDQTLLLVHGNFSSCLHFSSLLEKIPKDIHVVAPDLRGYGDSTYYRSIDSLADFAQDLIFFLEAKGIDKVNLLGWSLGGGVAMEMAARYPKVVERLILINSTTHRGYPIFKKDDQGQMKIGEAYRSKEELATDKVQVIPLLEAQKTNNFAVMNYIFDMTIYTVNKPNPDDNEMWIKESLKQRNLVDADWALANLNMSDQHNFYNAGTQNIQSIKVPVLHTWSKQDIVVPEYMVLENVKALEEQSKYIVYDQCGHSPFVDVLDQITKDILEFIQY
jgi:pimeloyl-ACP methyl ester carboxylesterase